MATTYDELMERFTKQEESAKAATLQREQQILAIHDEIIRRYSPGGEFGRAALGQLEKRKITDVGKETQQLISSGLYGTTTMGATGRRWEETVGAPERLRLEDIQMQRLSQAQLGKAGFIERREDIGPDYGMIAQLAAQAGQRPTRGGGGGGYTGAIQKPLFQDFPSLAEAQRTWAGAAGEQAGPTTTARPTAMPTIDPKSYGSYESYASAMQAAGRKPLVRSLWQDIKGISKFGRVQKPAQPRLLGEAAWHEAGARKTMPYTFSK